jgi:hypothetical protein
LCPYQNNNNEGLTYAASQTIDGEPNSMCPGAPGSEHTIAKLHTEDPHQLKK